MTLCRPFGPAKLARQAGLSVGDVSDILSGKRNPRVETAQTLQTNQYQADQKNKVLLEMIRDRCNKQSTRKIAKESGIDPSNLFHVLNGKRRFTALMRAKLEPIRGRRYF